MINTLQYNQYMNSYQWEVTKKKYYSRHGKECRACKTNLDLHVHHLSYDKLGAEEDTDLVCLCQKCHNYVHRYIKERKLDLRSGTITAINHIQSYKSALKPQISSPLDKSEFVSPTKNYKPKAVSGREGRLGGLPIKYV